MKWNWQSYGEYLDNFEGKVGINVGGLVGHIAVRHQRHGRRSRRAQSHRHGSAKDARLGAWKRWKAAHWACRPTATTAICARTASRWRAAWPTTKNFLRSAMSWPSATPGVIETILGPQQGRAFRVVPRTRQTHPAADSLAKPAASLGRAQSLARAARSRRADLQSRLSGLRLDPHGAAGAPFHFKGLPDLRRVPDLEKSDVPAGGSAQAGIRRSPTRGSKLQSRDLITIRGRPITTSVGISRKSKRRSSRKTKNMPARPSPRWRRCAIKRRSMLSSISPSKKIWRRFSGTPTTAATGTPWAKFCAAPMC